MAQPGLKGQLFSRSSILATPTLQGLCLGGVGEVASCEFAPSELLAL